MRRPSRELRRRWQGTTTVKAMRAADKGKRMKSEGALFKDLEI